MLANSGSARMPCEHVLEGTLEILGPHKPGSEVQIEELLIRSSKSYRHDKAVPLSGELPCEAKKLHRFIFAIAL